MRAGVLGCVLILMASAVIAQTKSTPGSIYRFDEGSGAVAHDSSGNGNDATISGATWIQLGSHAALHFQHTTDNVFVPPSAFTGFGDTAYFEADIRPTAFLGGCGTGLAQSMLFRKRADFNDWSIWFTSDGSLGAVIYGPPGPPGSGGLGVSSSPNTIQLNAWTKVAMSYDGLNLILYKDDREIARSTRALSINWFYGYVGTEIGNSTFDSNCAFNFTGDMANVRISAARQIAVPEPVINSVTPASITAGTTKDILISGKNFIGDSSVIISPAFTSNGPGAITINAVSVLDSSHIRVSVSTDAYARPGGYVTNVTTAGGTAIFSAPSLKRRLTILIPGTMGSFLQNDINDTVWLPITTPFLSLDEKCQNFLQMALLADGKSVSTDNNGYGLPCAGHGRPLRPDGIFNVWFRNFYGTLESALRAQNIEVAEFAYDWRLDLATNALLLRQLIEQNVAPAPEDRVDIVAHSQGGLLARTYLSRYGSDNRLFAVVYLSVPQMGTAQSYVATRGWSSFESLYGPLVGAYGIPIVPYTVATYLAANFASFYEMLPRYDFVYPYNSHDATEPFSTTYTLPAALGPFANTLNGGNLAPTAQDLWNSWSIVPKGVRSFSINGSGYNTLAGLELINGCIHPRDDLRGDGLVPFEPTGLYPPDSPRYYVLARHADVPNNALVTTAVTELLIGDQLVTSTEKSGVSMTPFVSGPLLKSVVCSPVELSLLGSQSTKVGIFDGMVRRDLPNSDFYVFPENEAATASFDEPVDIHLKSKGNSTFSLFVTALDASASRDDRYAFIDVPISVNSVADVPADSARVPALKLDIDGDGEYEFTLSPNVATPARVYLSVLQNVVISYRLSQGVTQALIATISAIDASLQKGNAQSACNQYGALRNKIDALVSKGVSIQQQDELAHIMNRGESAVPCAGR